jgi:hypothetical protein
VKPSTIVWIYWNNMAHHSIFRYGVTGDKIEVSCSSNENNSRTRDRNLLKYHIAYSIMSDICLCTNYCNVRERKKIRPDSHEYDLIEKLFIYIL